MLSLLSVNVEKVGMQSPVWSLWHLVLVTSPEPKWRDQPWKNHIHCTWEWMVNPKENQKQLLVEGGMDIDGQMINKSCHSCSLCRRKNVLRWKNLLKDDGGRIHPEATQQINTQYSSVAQSCLTHCDPMNRSMPGLPVHHQLPEFTQTHVHWVRDAIQPSHPLSSPSPPAPNPSQHQSLFQWVNSSHEVARVVEVQL